MYMYQRGCHLWGEKWSRARACRDRELVAGWIMHKWESGLKGGVYSYLSVIGTHLSQNRAPPAPPFLPSLPDVKPLPRPATAPHPATAAGVHFHTLPRPPVTTGIPTTPLP